MPCSSCDGEPALNVVSPKKNTFETVKKNRENVPVQTKENAKPKPRKHSEEIKKAAVAEFLSGKSWRDVCEKYDIRNSLLYTWRDQYYPKATEKKPTKPKPVHAKPKIKSATTVVVDKVPNVAEISKQVEQVKHDINEIIETIHTLGKLAKSINVILQTLNLMEKNHDKSRIN